MAKLVLGAALPWRPFCIAASLTQAAATTILIYPQRCALPRTPRQIRRCKRPSEKQMAARARTQAGRDTLEKITIFQPAYPGCLSFYDKRRSGSIELPADR